MAIYTFDENANVQLEAYPDTGYSFNGWQGALTGNDNPALIVMDASKTVMPVWLADAPPPPNSYTLEVLEVAGGNVTVTEIIEPPPPPPPPPNGYDFTVPGTYNDIYSIPFGSLGGKVGKISGNYSGTWQLGGLNNITMHFEKFSLIGSQLRLNDCNNVTLRGLTQDDFQILRVDDSHIRLDQCNSIIIDSAGVETPTSGGQTDCIYCQNTSHFQVLNSLLAVNNNDAGGHDDCIQMYRVGGDVLISGNTCLQNNDKTTNNQGIYATTTDRGGTFTFVNNYIGGTNSSGGRSAVKNCLTVRVLPELGGLPVKVEIRGNTVVSDGYNYVYMTGVTDYNNDIAIVNDFSQTKYGTDGINIS